MEPVGRKLFLRIQKAREIIGDVLTEGRQVPLHWVEEDSEVPMNRRGWIPCDQFDAEGDFQVSGSHGG